jgi:tRNA pseudouridine32 synthase / 23S rRNA pseudouridine746 synthase
MSESTTAGLALQLPFRQPCAMPTREGVGPSCVALPVGPWSTIMQYLAAKFSSVSAREWHERVTSGAVLDEHGAPVGVDSPYRAHQRIYYYRSVTSEPLVPFAETVIYRDELIVVADKPHFLPVTPSGNHLQETLLVRLKRRLGIDTLAPVHRIDRETAGLVMFTIDPARRAAYQALFAQREVLKRYCCVAEAIDGTEDRRTLRSRIVPGEHFMQMREEAGDPNATTHIERLERHGSLALYRLEPVTGRRHQLRVQCAARGMPILNDLIYPALRPPGSDDFARPLQLLAKSMSFTDPVTGRARHFESRFALQWPPDLGTTDES